MMKQPIIREAVWALLLMPIQLYAASTPFSVKDSIQMERFNTQHFDGQVAPSVANDSPNHAFGLILTSRGRLESNQLQSTLWLIDYRLLRTAFNEHRPSFPHSLLPLGSISAPPNVDARSTGAYGSVISDVRWSPDSRKVYFLGENMRGNRQLYSTTLDAHGVKSLTPPNQDVESFNLVQDTIVYRASALSEMNDHAVPGLVVAPGVSVVTDLPIADIIGDHGAQHLRRYDLWCIRHGKPQLVAQGSSSVQISSVLLAYPLALSPNGRFAIMLSQAKNIQPSWERFETADKFATLKLDHRDKRPISPYNSVNPLPEYRLVDTWRHTETELGAIDAHYFGFSARGQVQWAESGKHALITNVFLAPPTTEGGETTSISPCDAATFELETHVAQCLALGGNARADSADVRLLSASFAPAGNQIKLHYGTSTQELRYTKVYEYTDRKWQAIHSETDNGDADGEQRHSSITVLVKEGLNERPTLWAKDSSTGSEIKVWDPNTNFDHLELGDASVFHWSDRHGRPWSGGLFLPTGYVKGRRYPLVIQTHGFTPSKFILDGPYPTAMAARALASAGIMVLQIGGGGDTTHLGTSEEAADYVEGFETAIDALDSSHLIDPGKVGIVGFSRTCWYVQNALIHAPHRYAASIIADGVDYGYMQYHLFGPGNAFSQRDDEQTIGSVPFGKGIQKWIEHSPDFRADQITAPIRIEAIRPISILTEWELYSSLKLSGKAVDFIYYPFGQHVLQKPAERLASEQGNVDWFRFWLQGYKRPNPEDPDQYKRWEHLRELRDAETKAADAKTAGQ